MKKGALFVGLFALGSLILLNVASAEMDVTPAANILAKFMPSDFNWFEPGDEEDGCWTCKRTKGWKNNWHLDNAIGVSGTDEGKTIRNTGIGWISSKHAYSMMDLPVQTEAAASPPKLMKYASNSNTYCAWCHGPSLAKVTNDPLQTAPVKKDKPGVTCLACHCDHTTAGIFGTRFTNYLPGHPDHGEESFLARGVENGKKANAQCLFCHGEYHGFARASHESLVKKGDLRCIDCHMAVFNELDSGTHERYHNMKVYANGPVSCIGECHIHNFSNKEFAAKVAALMAGHTRKKHDLPSF